MRRPSWSSAVSLVKARRRRPEGAASLGEERGAAIDADHAEARVREAARVPAGAAPRVDHERTGGTPSAISRCTTSPTAPPAGSGTSMSCAQTHDPYRGIEAVEVV